MTVPLRCFHRETSIADDESRVATQAGTKEASSSPSGGSRTVSVLFLYLELDPLSRGFSSSVSSLHLAANSTEMKCQNSKAPPVHQPSINPNEPQVVQKHARIKFGTPSRV